MRRRTFSLAAAVIFFLCWPLDSSDARIKRGRRSAQLYEASDLRINLIVPAKDGRGIGMRFEVDVSSDAGLSRKLTISCQTHCIPDYSETVGMLPLGAVQMGSHADTGSDTVAIIWQTGSSLSLIIYQISPKMIRKVMNVGIDRPPTLRPDYLPFGGHESVIVADEKGTRRIGKEGCQQRLWTWSTDRFVPAERCISDAP